jgi:hypothetical protein
MRATSTLRIAGTHAITSVVHRATIGDAERVDVAAQRMERRPIALDEDASGCAARECLDAHRARAGVQIGHDGALDHPMRRAS